MRSAARRTTKAPLFLVHQMGGQAIIPFKGGKSAPTLDGHSTRSGAPGLRGSARLWKKAYAYFLLHAEEFYARYHKRSNVESVNSAIKRKFGEVLKSKNHTALTNELLCKVLAYNLTVVIHEMFESGIAVNFCTPNAQPAPGILAPAP